MEIVAILGSPRVNGNTSYLMDQALEEARSFGIETTKIALTQYQINPCQGHDKCEDFASCPQEDDTESIVGKIYGADGIILASPVYFYNVTGQLKTFVDRNRFYRRHKWKMQARCAGIIVVATAAGIEDTTNALIQFIKLTSKIPPEKVIQVQGFARIEGEIKSNTAMIEEARKLGRYMAEELLKT
jgi:multimeric flavodoxin WrbA